uniref:Uncharacterized protein n=1 Tax=Arundo donax TaxID=35708 RepID=A0A0A8Y785_ARUDO
MVISFAECFCSSPYAVFKIFSCLEFSCLL